MAAIIQRIESDAIKGDGTDFFDPSELAALLESTEELEVEDKSETEEKNGESI